MLRILLVVCSAGVLWTMSAAAQTTLNPDISVVGDFRGFIHDDESRPTQKDELKLADPAMELYATGYLNPYARASATVGWHPGTNAEIEEVYADILRGLPLRSSLRAGKYLLEFGRLNPVHEHAWSFMKRPLPHSLFFGDEGLSDMAVRLSFNVPTGDAYTELMGAVMKGDALTGHEHGEGTGHDPKTANVRSHSTVWLATSPLQDDEEIEDEPDLGAFGRATTSFAVSPTAELALGASAVNAVYELHLPPLEVEVEQFRATIVGMDIKYKSNPSRYTTFQIEAEGLVRIDDVEEGDDLASYGGYGYLDYRFRQRYNVGGIFEYVTTEHHEVIDGGEALTDETTWRAGLFAGFSPVEETSVVRLATHWTEPEEGNGFFEVTLQLVFSLGPHQPHNF